MRIKNKFILWFALTIQMFIINSGNVTAGGADNHAAAGAGEEPIMLFTPITEHLRTIACPEEIKALEVFTENQLPHPFNTEIVTLKATLESIHDGDPKALCDLVGRVRSEVTENGQDFLLLCALWGLSTKENEESYLRLGLCYHTRIPIVEKLAKSGVDCEERKKYWLKKVIDMPGANSLNYFQASMLLNPEESASPSQTAEDA